MEKVITLATLEKDLVFFKKMFHLVRLVDPVNKQVLEYGDQGVSSIDEDCYNYWQNDRICDNCISIRAYNNKKSFVKLEENGEIIMMVTAIPIETDANPVVLELLNDVTDSMMLGQGNYNEGRFMSHVISELNDLLTKDSLTEVYNRRFIDERLPVEITEAVIKDIPLTVVMMDIDNLRQINDQFGHLAGDKILREIGGILSKALPVEMGWSARYGGDEFLSCIKGDCWEGACTLTPYDLAERLRKEIECILVTVGDSEIGITVSMGIHTMAGEAGRVTAEEMIQMADQKLYSAKREGKNRIINNS